MKKSLNKNKKITVSKVGVCDVYEIGNWTDCYPSIKLGFKRDDYRAKYSDLSFYLKENDDIIGYFTAQNVINLNGQDLIPLYSKKLELCDFAVSQRAYAKYGMILLDFLLNYAKNNGYNAVVIKKQQNFPFFLEFVNRHYNLKEFDGYCYVIIDNPKIKQAEKHLTIYQTDKISLEDIYFLYDLKFSVGKNLIKLKLNANEFISVDRKTGIITFPSNVNLNNDNVVLNSCTKNIVYLVCEDYNNNQVQNLTVDFSVAHPNVFQAYKDDTLYVNKTISDLTNDVEYLFSVADKGVKFIFPYLIDYNMNDRSFSYSFGKAACNDLIEKYLSTCDSTATTLSEKVKERQAVKDFNTKLLSLKGFELSFGDFVNDVKTLSVSLGDDTVINTTTQKGSDVKADKEEIIKELKRFYMSNWKNLYNTNTAPKVKNSWHVKLVFENDTIEFKGFDDYPRAWIYVERFANKYGNFYLTKRQ